MCWQRRPSRSYMPACILTSSSYFYLRLLHVVSVRSYWFVFLICWPDGWLGCVIRDASQKTPKNGKPRKMLLLKAIPSIGNAYLFADRPSFAFRQRHSYSKLVPARDVFVASSYDLEY